MEVVITKYLRLLISFSVLGHEHNPFKRMFGVYVVYVPRLLNYLGILSASSKAFADATG